MSDAAADRPSVNATPPSGPLAREALALGAFDHVVARMPGFRVREGQREMAAHIAETLSVVDWPPKPEKGEEPPPMGIRAVAVVQAGTGVGKSAAYAATVIPLALAQSRRVMISTATVALQEQLIAKDLPALAQALPQPFAFALAKGRGRYVCRLKLDQMAGGDASTADLFGDDAAPAVPSDALEQAWAEQSRTYTEWAQQLDAGDWDGDRDRLAEPPDASLWSPVAAERHTCTARHCPSYNGCSYYQARARLAQAQVIVVNHDLLLSTLGLHALPSPSDCYLVFDEAHHLGAVAQGQFTESMDLMRNGWLDKLPRAVSDVAGAIGHHPTLDVAEAARELKTAQADLARLAMARLSESPEWLALTGRQAGMRPRNGRDAEAGFEFNVPKATERFEGGAIPEPWLATVGLIAGRAGALLKTFEALATELKALARDDPSDAARCAQLYSRIGTFAPRLQHLAATAELWLQAPEAGQPPLAKWLEAGIQNGLVTLTAHACPLQPGSLLRSHLWGQVRAAVATSASLVTCGGFDHFLHESGLAWDDAVAVREVQSPFDHARQGRLVVVPTDADPRDVDGYTREMLDLLLADLREVRRGALVLFTSKAQMKRAQELLERGQHRELRERVLVQGEASRTQLLKRHATRVADGEASVLFGLQSFGEGLDLPGELCEWVFITKLPFASPSDPVGQARADWLKAQGRDPFSELVVPATGARLLQWTGRALRSETDEAVVVCYDARLLRQGYGRRMLKGLPPYRLQRREAGGMLVDISR
ncbi:ATP-dependent DNA helicase DinG [Hydrogenophaga sp. NFH-34]|uniref:ATP-dependent DNA helicase DinG n=1 Tax=Hydrogenophaga sp. NFH-34 TaxID=2744446 RepID=UPI001F2175DE|nr:ATP-dependent DNA helicase DinG [Hydrogenophaga sp. NFH-34]